MFALILCCISVTTIQYSVCMAKISLSKQEGILKINSYECRVYESVDNSSLSQAVFLKPTKKSAQATKG